MVTVCGQVKSNIFWHKHAEKTNKEEPTMGSVLIQIQSVQEFFDTKTSFYSKTHNCNYTAQTDFVQSIPFLEVIYFTSNPQYKLIENLNAGDILNLQVWKEALYHNPNHFISIKENEKGQVKLWTIKVDGKESNLRSVEYLPNYNTKQKVNNTIKSTEEIIYMLVPSAKPAEENITNPDYFSVQLKPKELSLV